MRDNLKKISGIILLSAAMFLLSAGAVPAATLTVTKIADTNDGACNSDCSLREAIAAAASGDTIVFDATAFAGVQFIDLTSGELAISKNLNIQGTSAARLTVRRAASAASFRIFNIGAGRVVSMSRMTISGGATVSGGGGIFVDSNSTLNLSDAVVQGNTAISGGGITAISSTLNLTNVAVRQNASTANNGGGGGILSNGGNVNLNNSSLQQNSAAYRGGGIYSLGGGATVSISSSIVKNNSADERGGGAYIAGGSPFTISDSTFDSNVAAHGAGIFVGSASGTIRNSAVSRNRCYAYLCNGGGIANNAGANQTVSLTIFNSTVANNAGIYGGGIYNLGRLLLVNSTIAYNSTNGGEGLLNDAGEARLRNTLLAGNGDASGNDVGGSIISLGNNLVGKASGGEGFNAALGDIINPSGGAKISPFLLVNGGSTETVALLGGSPAIKNGNSCVRTQSCADWNVDAILTDQRAFNRQSTVDIGAYEFTPASGVLTVTKIADTNDGACNSDCSLREAINAAQSGNLIQFASPLFDSPQTITLSEASGFRTILIESKRLTISGKNAQSLIVRRAATATRRFRLLDVSDSVLTLNNLALTGGDTDGDGAGIRFVNGTLNLNFCHIFGNTVANGRGAAIYAFNNSVVNLANSTVSGNTANSSNSGGGGIHIEAELNVTNSTVSGNAKTGGINNGGGIWTSGATTITNSTVTDNVADGAGSAGGIFAGGAATQLNNSIVANNGDNATFPDVAGNFQSGGYNLIGNRGASAAFIQTGDQTGDENDPVYPALDALALNGASVPTHALLSDSPAIDKGKSFGATTDQRGQRRPFDQPNLPSADGGDSSDIGAFERQVVPNAAPQVFASPTPVTTNQNTPAQIRLLASDANADPLTITITNQPTSGAISNFTTTPQCTIDSNNISNCDQNVVYTPNQNFTGTDSFSFKANDGQVDSAVFTVPIVVNAAPIAVNDAYATDQNFPLTVAAPGVLANDTSPGQNPLTAVLVSNPANGTVSLNSNGSFTYTPNNNFNGADSFTYQANNGTSNSNVATVNITVRSLTVTKIADTNDGVCDADCSLREAIASAPPGGTIVFDTTVFNTPQVITLSDAAGFRELVINKNLNIVGAGAKLLTVRRAANAATAFRVFSIYGNITVNLSGMIIAGGSANGVTGGGGVSNTSGSQLTISDSHIKENNAAYGAGIFNDSTSSLTLIRSTVSGNTADCQCGGGAGINSDGALVITNSTVSGNVKTNGDGNAAGGIYIYNGNATITSTTVSDNGAPGINSAGGIFRAGGSVTVRNTIIAANRNNSTIPDVFGEFISGGYNLVGNVGATTNFSNTGDQKGDAAMPLDPRLRALTLGSYGTTPTHWLLSGSPALDKGNSFGLTTDQRGVPRPIDLSTISNAADGADIGAYESLVTPPVSVAGTIVYGTTQNGQTTKYVAGVTLEATGGGFVTTNANGVYSFNLNAGGNYIITPTKTGDVNGITAFDATLVLRCVAAGSNCTLTANQKIAADANNNGTLSAFDATLILRFAAAQTSNATTGQVGNWKFSPAQNVYNSLSDSLSNENYTAILIGEVNGNWQPN